MDYAVDAMNSERTFIFSLFGAGVLATLGCVFAVTWILMEPEVATSSCGWPTTARRCASIAGRRRSGASLVTDLPLSFHTFQGDAYRLQVYPIVAPPYSTPRSPLHLSYCLRRSRPCIRRRRGHRCCNHHHPRHVAEHHHRPCRFHLSRHRILRQLRHLRRLRPRPSRLPPRPCRPRLTLRRRCRRASRRSFRQIEQVARCHQ